MFTLIRPSNTLYKLCKSLNKLNNKPVIACITGSSNKVHSISIKQFVFVQDQLAIMFKDSNEQDYSFQIHKADIEDIEYIYTKDLGHIRFTNNFDAIYSAKIDIYFKR